MDNIKNDLLGTLNWKEKTVGFVKRNLVYFAVVILVVGYVIGGFIEIIETQKPIENIIVDGLLALIVGWIITSLFGLGGSVSGQADINFIKTKQGYGEVIAKQITPHIEKLDFFCEDETKEALRRKQTNLLLKGALSYEKFINGEYDSISTLTEHKKGMLEQARKAQIKPLTSAILLSENEDNEDETSFGRNPKQFKRSRFTKTLSSKLITMLIFGYYSMTLRDGVDWGAIIWATIQVAVFLALGILEWLNAYNYEISEHRQAIIKKTNYLLVFYNKVTSNPKLYDERINKIKKAITIKESEVESGGRTEEEEE